MTRWTILGPIVLVVVLGAWLVSKDAIGAALHNGGTAVTAEAPDYSDPTSWLISPLTAPPPTWEAGWAIDYLVLPPVPKRWTAPGLIDPDNPGHRAAQLEVLAGPLEHFKRLGAVYSPAIRLPAPGTPPGDWQPAADDATRAIDTYFDTLNGGRGVIVVLLPGHGAIAPDIRSALEARSGVEQARIVSLFALTQGPDDFNDIEGCRYGELCPYTMGIRERPTLTAVLAPQPQGGLYPLRPANHVVFEGVVTGLHQDGMAYLETEAPRPAEPLGGFQTIEIAPVFTPDGERIDDAPPESAKGDD